MNRATEAEHLRQGADLDALPRLMGMPPTQGVIRADPADFVVRESLAFELTGTGEHLYMLVRKTGQNTRWVARQLAQACGLPFRAIGFAGMKDRHAVTEQWFSLHLPGREDPEVDSIEIDGVEIVDCCRHSGKLRIGALAGNWFRIVIRELTGDREVLECRLGALRDGYVPNYFGAQRFGKAAGNLELFGDLESPVQTGREARSFGLSALRSALFNNFLAQRIDDRTAEVPFPGEIVFCALGNRFRHEFDFRDCMQGFGSTGLLWGSGDSRATEIAAEYENRFFTQYPATTKLLEQHEVRMMRRPLMIRPQGLEWQVDGQHATVIFSLARGQYATAVLRELVTWPA